MPASYELATLEDALAGVRGRTCHVCNGRGSYNTHVYSDGHRLEGEQQCVACHGSGTLPLEPGSVRALILAAQAAYESSRGDSMNALHAALAAFTLAPDEETTERPERDYDQDREDLFGY